MQPAPSAAIASTADGAQEIEDMSTVNRRKNVGAAGLSKIIEALKVCGKLPKDFELCEYGSESSWGKSRESGLCVVWIENWQAWSGTLGLDEKKTLVYNTEEERLEVQTALDMDLRSDLTIHYAEDGTAF